VLTISDRSFAGERADESGPAIEAALPQSDYEVARRQVVPDEVEEIGGLLRRWLPECDVILTTGGTGLSPRDVTPEATMEVAQKVVPGIAEALRAEGLRHNPYSMLSRSLAVVADGTLIVNLPGNPNAVRECMEVLLTVIPHAVALIAGRQVH
jgi:molybdopterin adenylyltransferase